MPRIKNKLNQLIYRENIEKKTKYEVVEKDASHLVGSSRKKLYDYYECDYCGDEIQIQKRFEDKKGGIVIIPNSVTKKGNIRLTLCTKCLNPVLREFEECE